MSDSSSSTIPPCATDIKRNQHSVAGWTLTTYTSAISTSDLIESFEASSEVKCPEMVWLTNKLVCQHRASNFTLSFNTPDALLGTRLDAKKVSGIEQIKVKDQWALQKGGGNIKTVEQKYDWTYSTNYQGTTSFTASSQQEDDNNKDDDNSNNNHDNDSVDDDDKNNSNNNDGNNNSDRCLEEPAEIKIPIEMLGPDNPIVWFDAIDLYEDELHDNGVCSLTVKIRAMKDCFLVLMRLFVRVDDVLIRIRDTRIFHDFATNYLIREFHVREETFEELAARNMPTNNAMYQEVDRIAHRIKMIDCSKQKINLPVEE